MKAAKRVLVWCLCIVGLTVFALIVVTDRQTPAPSPVVPSVRVSTTTPSAWDKPTMSANAQTIEITDSTRNLTLDPNTDYYLKCDNTGTLTWGLVAYGGHNVIFENCTYNIGSVFAGAVQFKNQTGTLWVHDVHFKGTNLEEGIDLQEPNPGVAVVLRDVLVDPVYDEGSNHADLLQTWCGPAKLLIDGLSGQTNYQGFFLLPNQNGGCATTTPQTFDFRHVDIKGVNAFGRDSATMLWAGWYGSTSASNVDLNTSQVFAQDSAGGAQFWPNMRQWQDVNVGTPPYGPFVISSSWGATGPDEPCSGPGCSNQQGSYGAGEDPMPLLGEQQ